MLESDIQAFPQREKAPVVFLKSALHSMIPMSGAKCAHEYNSGTQIMGTANCFLIGFKPLPQVKIQAWFCKPGQKLMALEVVSPITGLNTDVFLKEKRTKASRYGNLTRNSQLEAVRLGVLGK